MFHGRLQILPCSPANPKAITQWLNDQAKAGLSFRTFLLGQIALFRKSEKKDTQYVLRTSKAKASDKMRSGLLSPYFVYKLHEVPTQSEVKKSKIICIRLVLWIGWVFGLLNFPGGEFPIEYRWSWLTVGAAFLTIYFLIDVILHLPYIFTTSYSSKYGKWGKLINCTALCVLFIAIAFIITSKFYTPVGQNTQPILRDDSKRAYITEKYVPFGRRTEYTEHLAHGDSLQIADYQFVNSGFADYFFELYCNEIRATEITKTDADICNELVRLFNYNENDPDLQIFSNRTCSLFLVKNGRSMIRFGRSFGIDAHDIFYWLQR